MWQGLGPRVRAADPSASGVNALPYHPPYHACLGTTFQHSFYKHLTMKPPSNDPLQGLMKTAAGAHIAEGRHAFMEQYLRRFRDEWNGCA